MKFHFSHALLFALLATPVGAGIKTESFTHDPNWEEFNNHVTPKRIPDVVQDFGYRTSNIAGKEGGEIGGQVWRSSTRASYAARISAKTLREKLSASGSFAITTTSGSSGAFFGWFNGERTGAGRRDTLGFRFAGEGSGARLTLQLVTDKNQACGTKITPWVVDKTKARGQGRKFRPTSIRNDGTRYVWTLNYDPDANDGNGQIQFSIRGNSPKPEEFEGKTFTIVLPEGYKAHGTTFDRFGMMNSERGGHAMTIYFDDLHYDGETEDFLKNPGWIGTGNDAKFADSIQGGAHDFGFCAESSHAGGAAGEIGGLMWRSGVYGYYADRLEELTLNDRLEASGKVILEAAPPDSGMYLGWFNSAEKENAPQQAGNFVGIKIGGPTRVGHYFAPAYATQKAKVVRDETREHPKRVSVERSQASVLVPQKRFEWKLVYDPDGNGGSGEIHATLSGETVTLALKSGDRAAGGKFDRFGLFTTHVGGSYVRIYFDDLSYTANSLVRGAAK
jgi:hypothetical protein